MDGHDGGHGGDLGVGVGHGHSADLNFGHDLGLGHHGGFGGHHGGTVTSEALMVSHSFSHGHNGFDAHFHGAGGLFGPGLDIGHVGGWSHGEGVDKQKAEQARRYLAAVERAKTDPNRRYYGAHIVGHGYSDVAAVFTRLATQCGLIRICNTVGNFNPVDLTDVQLSDWASFYPPYSRLHTPLGYYPGAIGLTRVFKQYWQVADKKHWWQGGKPKYDRTKSTYLEVSIVTWFYGEVGDYETRVDLNIVSVPVLDRWDKIWARRGKPLGQHQTATKRLCQLLFDELKQAAPTEAVRARRAVILGKKADEARIAEDQKKPHLPQVGQSGADLDTLFDDAPLEKDPLDTAVAKAPAATPAAIPAKDQAAPVVTPVVTPVTPAADEKIVFVPVTIPPPRLKTTEQE